MFNPSLSQLLVEARVEQIHRAARNDGRGRRAQRRRQVDRSPRARASRVTRAVARAFDGGRSASDDAAGVHGFESSAMARATTWSHGRRPPRS